MRYTAQKPMQKNLNHGKAVEGSVTLNQYMRCKDNITQQELFTCLNMSLIDEHKTNSKGFKTVYQCCKSKCCKTKTLKIKIDGSDVFSYQFWNLR